jgi:hypothetical protein
MRVDAVRGKGDVENPINMLNGSDQTEPAFVAAQTRRVAGIQLGGMADT